MDDVSSVDRGPRQEDNLSQTGTGSPRSSDSGEPAEGAAADNARDVSDAVVTGATTSSHPSAADDVTINRSGSGGTGGPMTDDEPADG